MSPFRAHIKPPVTPVAIKRGVTIMKKLVIVTVTLLMILGLAGIASAAGAMNTGAMGISV